MMRRIAARLVVAAFAAFTAWVVIAASRPDPTPVGSRLPDLSVRDLATGRPARISATQGQGLIVVVYHTTCPACRETLRMFEGDLGRLDSLDLGLALVTGEEPSVAKGLREDRTGLSKSPRVLWFTADEDELDEAFPLPGTPGLYVFDADGVLVNKEFGQRTLSGLLGDLFESRSPESPVTGGAG